MILISNFNEGVGIKYICIFFFVEVKILKVAFKIFFFIIENFIGLLFKYI